jgi:cell cycle checkpoint protein
MQIGVAFVDKSLFTTYKYSPHPIEPEGSQDNNTEPVTSDPPAFQISFPALLETLQIFGAADTTSRFNKPDNDGYGTNIRPHRPNAFSNQTLDVVGVCRLSYEGPGSPFSIILEESGVTTTCDLVTYEPEFAEEIPFQRDRTEVKIIMQARWLFDAMSELSSTTPDHLDIVAAPTAPWLSLSATGPLGSASVEFAKSRELLETFTVAKNWTQRYKFDMVKAASEAMRVASKVSLRGDEEGVLSLQFMVEVEGCGISFVDFRFVPLLTDDVEETASENEEEDLEVGSEGD